MLSVILVKMIIDQERYEERNMKLFKMYIFEDGQRLLTRSDIGSREINHEENKHRKVIRVITEEDEESVEGNNEQDNDEGENNNENGNENDGEEQGE